MKIKVQITVNGSTYESIERDESNRSFYEIIEEYRKLKVEDADSVLFPLVDGKYLTLGKTALQGAAFVFEKIKENPQDNSDPPRRNGRKLPTLSENQRNPCIEHLKIGDTITFRIDRRREGRGTIEVVFPYISVKLLTPCGIYKVGDVFSVWHDEILEVSQKTKNSS